MITINSLPQYDTGIYKIVNKVNGKVYVGQSVNMRNRYARHLNSLRKNKHYNQYLQRSFNKYKEESFYAEVLEFCKPEELNHKERYWIKRLKSEYKDYGYNAPYAYKVFDEYDKITINKTRKKHNEIIFTEEIKRKISNSLKDYYKDSFVSEKHSMSCTKNVNYKQVKKIKHMLAHERHKSKKDIAKELQVNENTVEHISNLASHKSIDSHLNYLIKNRTKINKESNVRKAIKLYREGHSYQHIANKLGIHLRTALRLLDKNKTHHDDRCRLNVINYVSTRNESLIALMIKLGKTHTEISRLLNVSKGNVSVIKNGNYYMKFTDVKDTRGKPIRLVFNYNVPNIS